MATTFREDFTSPEGREGGISGVLLPGENGYLRAVFMEPVREIVQRTFKQIFSDVLEEYKPIDARREANIRAYEATAIGNEPITLPVIKRDVNQQQAWLWDAIFSKDPVFSTRALDNDQIEVLVDDGDGLGPHIVLMPADEYAKQLQALVNFYALHKIGLKKTFRTWIAEMLRDGNRPPILKVIYEDREREVAALQIVKDQNDENRIIRIEKDPVYVTVKDGESARIEGVPGTKFFVPLPWDDIQKAPFVFQEFEEDIATIKDKVARGIYDFCSIDPDKVRDRLDLILSGGTTPDDVERYRADGRKPKDPIKPLRLFELWFDYPFTEPLTDPMTGEMGTETNTRMIPFCAVVHWPSGEWMNCYENPRWDKKRPFFAGRMQDRPHSFAGYSTAENCAPFQRLMTQLFNAQLQNIAISNVKTFGIREGSVTWRFFKQNGGKLRPGMIWPFGDQNDVKTEPLGTPIGSNANEIGFLNSESEKMSVVPGYSRGQVPGRTPVGTIDAIDDKVTLQPRMTLDQIRDVVSEVLECFVRTLAQFNPAGVRVPFRDPKMTDGVDVRVVGFPVEWRDGVFSFDITATGNEETAQALTMSKVMLTGEVDKYHGATMGIMASTFMPGTPPPIMLFGMELLRGRRNIIAKAFEHNKLNPDEFLPSEAMIRQLPQQLMELQALAKEIAAAEQQTNPQLEGAPNVASLPTGPRGIVPSGEGPGAPMGGMGGPPNDQGAAVMGAAPNL